MSTPLPEKCFHLSGHRVQLLDSFIFYEDALILNVPLKLNTLMALLCQRTAVTIPAVRPGLTENWNEIRFLLDRVEQKSDLIPVFVCKILSVFQCKKSDLIVKPPFAVVMIAVRAFRRHHRLLPGQHSDRDVSAWKHVRRPRCCGRYGRSCP